MQLVSAIRYELSTGSEFPKGNSPTFFEPLALAWDVLPYDSYETGSEYERWAGRRLSKDWTSPSGNNYLPTASDSIKLSDRLQIKIIDALTEVAGIPHQKGQAEFRIPEKLRNYDRYRESSEYKIRLALAKAKQRA